METDEYLKRERANATEVIQVAKHKTGRYRGPAKLVIKEPTTIMLLQKYYMFIRKPMNAANTSLDKRFFLLPNGSELRKVYEMMQMVATQFEKELPTPTTHRKVIATKAKDKINTTEAKLLQDHMGHSEQTSHRYYQVHTTEAAIQSHATIRQLSDRTFSNKEIAKILHEWPLETNKTPSLLFCSLICNKYNIQKDGKQVQDKWKALYKNIISSS